MFCDFYTVRAVVSSVKNNIVTEIPKPKTSLFESEFSINDRRTFEVVGY